MLLLLWMSASCYSLDYHVSVLYEVWAILLLALSMNISVKKI